MPVDIGEYGMVFFLILLLLVLMGIASVLGWEARRRRLELRWINTGRVVTWGLILLVTMMLFRSVSGGPTILGDFSSGIREFWSNLTNGDSGSPDPANPYYQDPPDPSYGPYDSNGG